MDHRTARSGSLSHRDWTLVAAGLLAWVLLIWGGVWLMHQLTRKPENCSGAIEAPTRPVQGAPTGPRNAVQLLTGSGRCA